MKIYNVEKDENAINELANILKNNGVIAVPTDTVYGLCAIMSIEQKPSFKEEDFLLLQRFKFEKISDL